MSMVGGFMSFFYKSPQDRIRKADASIQRLRDKRSKLDSFFDETKINKINSKIHKNNVEIDIAKRELNQPKIDNSVKTVSFNKIDKGTHLHIHGHYHSSRKK